MNALGSIFLLGLLALPLRAALQPPPPYFDELAQDGEGIVWAYSRAESNRLYRFDGTRWSEERAGFADGTSAMPAGLARTADGAVACVWRVDDTHLAVTRHRGDISGAPVTGQGFVSGSGLEVAPFADSQGRLWITGRTPQISWIDSDGRARYYRIPPEQSAHPAKNWQECNSIFAAEDGQGRVWAWTNEYAGGPGPSAIRGVLIFTEEEVRQVAEFEELGQARYTAMIRRDDTHLWIGVLNRGLYSIDIDTMRAEPVPEPEPGAFRCVAQMFTAGDDLYLVAEVKRVNALWRMRDGKWTCLQRRLDTWNEAARPWLASEAGLLIGAQPSPWLLPEDGPPVRLDWRHGVALDGLRGAVRMADGKTLALLRQGQFYHGRLAPEPAPATDRVREIEPRGRWTVDARGEGWWLPQDSADRMLRHWDGTRIVEHALPPELKVRLLSLALADAQGRIWLFPNGNEKAVGFFESQAGSWRVFPKIEQALLAVRDDPPHFPETQEEERDWRYVPQFSADGRRFTYARERAEVVYFDGAAWHRWRRAEMGPVKDKADILFGPPFFDRQQRLCVNTRFHGTRRYDEDASQWVETDPDYRFTYAFTEHRRPVPPKPVPPRGVGVARPQSIIRDNLGTLWMNTSDQLYHCVDTACVPVFAPGEAHPFTGSRSLRKATVMRGGAVLLETAAQSSEYFLVEANQSPPQPVLKVTRTATDSFHVALSADPPATRYHWSLDESGWQPASGDELTFDFLAAGVHTLRVLAFDTRLQSEGVAAEVTLTAEVDPEEQMDLLITALGGSDTARNNAAVAALARQPDRALPALEKARESFDEDRRWWIEAAIQEVQRQRK